MPLLTNRLVLSSEPRGRPYEVRDSRLKGLLLRVQPSGYRSYVVTLGRGRRMTIGSASVFTPDQARERAKKYLGQLADGKDPLSARKVTKSATLEDFLHNEYGPWFVANRKSGDPILRRIKHCFLKDFGRIRLNEISPLQVDRWRLRRLKDGLSKSTLNRDLSALKAAYSKAVEWGLVNVSPIAGVRLYGLDDNSGIRHLSQVEAKRLYEALQARDEHLRKRRSRFNDWRQARNLEPLPEKRSGEFPDRLTPIVVLALNTGMRRGEIFNLNWSDVDFSKASLQVLGPGAKSGRTRHIPLNTKAIEILKKWRRQSTETGRVFPGDRGGRLTNINRAWAALIKRAELPDFRFHDCRHHFASSLVMADVPLNTVRELLGHSEISMTLRYAHLAPEHKAEAVQKLVAV